MKKTCTCDKSAICDIHAPSGAALGPDKIIPSVYVIVDVEKQIVYSSDEEFKLVELQSIHKSYEKACAVAESLVKENSEIFFMEYEHVGGDDDYLSVWRTEEGHYIAIKEMKLEE